MASAQAADTSNNSNRSLSRHRSLSPYNPEGNGSQFILKGNKNKDSSPGRDQGNSNVFPTSFNRSLNNGTPLSPRTDQANLGYNPTVGGDSNS